MASITSEKNGRKAIQFCCPDGKRRTIRLGKIHLGTAKRIRDRLERIAAAVWSGQPPENDDRQWLAEIDPRLHKRIAAAGLCEPRQDMTLAQWIEKYLCTHQVKTSTRDQLERTRDNLYRHFGKDRQLRVINAEQAKAWRYWLATEGNERTKSKDKSLAENTVRRRTGRAKQLFAAALDAGLIESNPFEKLASTVTSNEKRQQFIPADWIERCIKKCSGDWPIILALARYAGLRCPSELSIPWENVNLPERWIRIESPKTGPRVCPILPDLVPHLETAWELRGDRQHLINRNDGRNLGTEFTRIIKRAGLIPWPKLFQNLRASRETELMDSYATKDVAAWLGNSAPVAMAHYAIRRDEIFQKAIREGIPKSVQKAVQ